MSRFANRGRKELRGWFQNKTDGGKVHRNSTDEVETVTVPPMVWRTKNGWINYGEGYQDAMKKAYDYLFNVHGEPKDGHILDGWIRKHYDE